MKPVGHAAGPMGLLLLARAVTAAFPDCSNGPLSRNAVCDLSRSPVDRATALVKAFTLDEKFNNTGSTAPGVPRLGLPPYEWWQEALHGVATNNPGVHFSDAGEFSYATSFPQPSLMSGAFDDELVHQVASVISTEARAFSNAGRAGLDFWTPNINPYRDPRWGRGQETPGEDPYHISSYVKSLIEGLQGGSDPAYKKIIATCKHFAGYDLEAWHEYTRYDFDANITMQELGEYYVPGFQTCARDANAGSFMCTYSALNGVPTCADEWLLGDLLRDHWGWTNEDQYITSDCDSIQNVYSPHHWSVSPAAAAADSLKAGTDLNCGTYYQLHLPQAYAQGLIKESDLDRALIRQYAGLVRLGYFDPAARQPYRSLGWKDVNTASSQELAYTAAAQGVTLLKNDGLLPLGAPAAGKTLNVALIGDWANATTQLQGNYYGIAPYLITPLQALKNVTGVHVTYAQGLGGQGDPTTNNWYRVFEAANASDVILYVGGVDNSVESEGKDRVTIGWSAIQLDLIEELSQVGKPMAVVQMGGPLDNSPIVANHRIGGLLYGGYPGQSGGQVIVDTLFGKNAPAGRLSTTQYPASYVSVPMSDMNLRPDGKLNPGRTYMWYNGTAVFPFGFGKHYTTFTAQADLSRKQMTFTTAELKANCSGVAHLDLCPFAAVHASIRNTGKTKSDYAALAFIRGAFGPLPRPHKSLVAYTRLHDIEPSTSKTAVLNLTLGSLSRWDVNGRRILYPGQYTVGIDTTPELAEVSFTITGDEIVLDALPPRRH